MVAAGASHAYFGHDEWASAAPGLKTVATIGRLAAVLDVRGVRLSGTLAWLAYLFVHLFYLVGLQNRVLVVIRWAVSLATHGRGARLITGAQGEPERRAAARPGSASRGSAGA